MSSEESKNSFISKISITVWFWIKTMYLRVSENTCLISLQINNCKISLWNLPRKVRESLSKLTVDVSRIRNKSCIIVEFLIISFDELLKVKQRAWSVRKCHFIDETINELKNRYWICSVSLSFVAFRFKKLAVELFDNIFADNLSQNVLLQIF